jgi:saccharopine dehydrogenase-like NADP-dependent oxidoreductase
LGRYVAVNLENEQTIEFRMFRGTLRYRTFVATLQLVHEICMLAIKLTDQDLESMSWCDFVSRIDREEKKELIEYLKTKRLYVNELAEEREEM